MSDPNPKSPPAGQTDAPRSEASELLGAAREAYNPGRKYAAGDDAASSGFEQRAGRTETAKADTFTGEQLDANAQRQTGQPLADT